MMTGGFNHRQKIKQLHKQNGPAGIRRAVSVCAASVPLRASSEVPAPASG